MAGRPTKYKKAYCKTLVDLMKEGASLTEVCAHLDITRQTLHNWCDQNPEFLDAKKKGEALSAAWWEHQARTNLKDKSFNAALWYMNMKNRFGWSDRQQVDVTSTGKPVTGFFFDKPNDDSSDTGDQKGQADQETA